jgi:hypothetical protein
LSLRKYWRLELPWFPWPQLRRQQDGNLVHI